MTGKRLRIATLGGARYDYDVNEVGEALGASPAHVVDLAAQRPLPYELMGALLDVTQRTAPESLLDTDPIAAVEILD